MGAQNEAIETIYAHLDDLRAQRPSVALMAKRSPKGGRTLVQILDAARAVFIREGHAGLSLRKVADEAGVAVGNVNYYFSSKRVLLEAMLREVLADYVEQHVDQINTDRDSPLDILLNVVAFYVRNGYETHQLFFQIWGYAGSDEQAKILIRDLYRPIGRFIYYLVRAANKDLTDSQIRQIVLHICSLEEGVKLFIGMGPDDDPAIRRAEEAMRALTKRLVCGD